MSKKLYRVVTARPLLAPHTDERVLGHGRDHWPTRATVELHPDLELRMTAAEAVARAIEEQERDDRTQPQNGWRTWVEEVT